MGRNRYKIYHPQQPHFLTNTILNWIPIFTRPTTVNIILESFQYLQQHHQLKLYGFVILENHMHWLAQSENLPKDIERFKSYTAKMIIRHLQQQGQTKLLKQLAFYKKQHKKDRQYQLWEEGSHPEEIQGSRCYCKSWSIFILILWNGGMLIMRVIGDIQVLGIMNEVKRG